MPYDDIERIAEQLSGLQMAPRAAPGPPKGEASPEAFAAWALAHPNANERFANVERMAAGKRVAVFLDYDGTLTPIVSNPDRAYMTDEMRGTIRALAGRFPTAIISGRGREIVQGFVRLDELFYAGSHGLDIVGPGAGAGEDGERVLYQPAAAYVPEINAVHDELVEAVRGIEGSRVDHNKFCISVHFRNCREESWEELKGVVEAAAAKHPSLTITRGRKVLELRPNVEWDKGRALLYLLRALGLEGPDVLPIYLGDDRTDEDAFRVLRGETSGLGVLVSTKPKETQATYHLLDPAEVLVFLSRIAALPQAPAALENGKEPQLVGKGIGGGAS
eukprot:evm.model.scf_2613.2 EVM.evm.TU.scf_2613.2   scf_2613:12007-13712(+)